VEESYRKTKICFVPSLGNWIGCVLNLPYPPAESGASTIVVYSQTLKLLDWNAQSSIGIPLDRNMHSSRHMEETPHQTSCACMEEGQGGLHYLDTYLACPAYR